MTADARDGPGSQPPSASERRSGKDRRQTERRDLELPVEKDRRSPGWDRRSGERRTGPE